MLLASLVASACGSREDASDGTGDADPSDGTGGADPSDGTGGADPSDGTGGADPSDGTGGADPSDGTGGADPSETSSATETIGPLGGALQLDGVEVQIPTGALSDSVQLTLTVGTDALVTVTPDITFQKLATVRVDGARWAMGGPRIAKHSRNDEWYMIEPVTANDDGSWEYTTIEFSSTFGAPARLVTDDLSAWSVGDVWEKVRETSRTILPSNIDRSDVRAECLTNVSSAIGTLHDAVDRLPGHPSEARSTNEYALMTEEAATALAIARSAFRSEHPGYDIWVNGAWDSSGTVHGTPSEGNIGSVHYFGAALDLGISHNGKKIREPGMLGLLPPLLLNAGFTWVLFEDESHVHASISSPSLSACICNATGQLCFGSDRAGIGLYFPSLSNSSGLGLEISLDGVSSTSTIGLRDLNSFSNWCPFQSAPAGTPEPDPTITSVQNVPPFCGDHPITLTLVHLTTGGGDDQITWPVTISNNGVYGGTANAPTYVDTAGTPASFVWSAPGSISAIARFGY